MTINSFDDILQAMEQDPALREAMRRHILTEELLQLPAQVNRLETSVAQLQESQNRLETSVAQLQEGQNRLETSVAQLQEGQNQLETSVAQLQEGQNQLETSVAQLQEGQNQLETSIDNLEAGQEELKGRIDSMAGRLGDAVGHAYEARAVGLTPRRLRQVMGIGSATLIMAATQPSSYEMHQTLYLAVEDGLVSETEAEDLENLDLIFTGQDLDGNTVQAAIEASVTVNQQDIRRAVRRAEILERATRVPSRPAVIGENISPEDQSEAENLGVAFLHMPAHRE